MKLVQMPAEVFSAIVQTLVELPFKTVGSLLRQVEQSARQIEQPEEITDTVKETV